MAIGPVVVAAAIAIVTLSPLAGDRGWAEWRGAASDTAAATDSWFR